MAAWSMEPTAARLLSKASLAMFLNSTNSSRRFSSTSCKGRRAGGRAGGEALGHGAPAARRLALRAPSNGTGSALQGSAQGSALGTPQDALGSGLWAPHLLLLARRLRLGHAARRALKLVQGVCRVARADGDALEDGAQALRVLLLQRLAPAGGAGGAARQGEGGWPELQWLPPGQRPTGCAALCDERPCQGALPGSQEPCQRALPPASAAATAPHLFCTDLSLFT
jgi:hypothetical protein